MEDPLVYIIRGLPSPLDHGAADALADHLEEVRTGEVKRPGKLLALLEAASRLMVPLPEYDISDFSEGDILKALDSLASGDDLLWGQLLDALNDDNSPHYARLKQMSPYAGELLAFYDITDDVGELRLDLEQELAHEIMRRSDVHDFPGNSGMVVVPREALDLMRFVDCVDNVPATA